MCAFFSTNIKNNSNNTSTNVVMTTEDMHVHISNKVQVCMFLIVK